MSERTNSVSQDESPRRAKRAAKPSEAENVLAPVVNREAVVVRPAAPPGAVARSPKEARPRTIPVPEEIRQRFVQIRNSYYFADGAKAFTDRGNRLTTPSENTEVIRGLVAIAEVRGWSEVAVRGTERFRREAWAAAQAAGIQVRGYQPTEFEQSRLVRSLAGRAQGSSDSSLEEPVRDAASRPPKLKSQDSLRRGQLLTGRLVEHGRAPYRHDMKEPMSYYVKIETPQGDRTLWGVDLERAFRESLSRPKAGDEVGVRSLRQEPVTVKTERRDAEGAVVGHRDLATHRNRWIVEKREFFDERASAARTLRDTSIDPKQGARQHPELVGTYLQVRAAELAAKKMRDPEDQKRFVAKVREALAISVARGEPLPPVRVKERAPAPPSRPPRTPDPAHARA